MIVAALAVMLAPPARSESLRDLVGRLTAQACARLATGWSSEAEAIVYDAHRQWLDALQSLDVEVARAARGFDTASDAAAGEYLARVEFERRRAAAFQVAYRTIIACYTQFATDPARDLRTNRQYHVSGKWDAQCTYANDPKLVSRTGGTFFFELYQGNVVNGEYSEAGGPKGVVRGRWWRQTPNSSDFALEGSASSGVGDTQGVWSGVLQQLGASGRGDVHIKRSSVDITCVGQWRVE
jgi:hypothetical protein